MTSSPYKSFKLENGIRVFAEKISTVESVSVGLFFKSGVLYEKPGMLGASHFIEHMLFKGTFKRTAGQIASEFDRVGGHLNAFTAKDYACYYARIVKDKLETALDILSDMVKNSCFDEKEFQRERGIILEEIKMYEDSPDELVHELLGSGIWGETGLGSPILGTAQTVGKMNRDVIYKEFRKQYVSNNMCICLAGNFDEKELEPMLRHHFADMQKGSFRSPAIKTFTEKSANIVIKEIEQVHVAMGVVSVPFSDKRRYALTVLNAAFGGGMSSRLFQEVRENRGLAYNVYSYHTSFKHSGMFGMYAGTSMDSLEMVLELFYSELKKIIEHGLTKSELEDTIEQLKGNVFIALESTMNRMNRLSTEFLYNLKARTPEETLKPYLKVTREDILKVARQILKEEDMAVSMIAPNEKAAEIFKKSPFSTRNTTCKKTIKIKKTEV